MKEITTIVSTYNRPTYTRRSLKDLFRKMPKQVPIWIFDDHSTMPNFKKMLEYIPTNREVKITRHGRNLGAGYFGLEFACVDTPYMYITDNDVTYSSRFEQMFWRALGMVQSGGRIVSLFRVDTQGSTIHTEHECNIPGFIGKSLLGGVSIMAPTNLFRDFVQQVKAGGFKAQHVFMDKPAYDGAFCEFAAEHGYELVCSEDSYVYHFGDHSMVRPEKGRNTDLTVNFTK